MKTKNLLLLSLSFSIIGLFNKCTPNQEPTVRERISINNNWKFYKYPADSLADNLIYDERPEVIDKFDGKQADSKPTEAIEVETTKGTLKAWIMPSGNKFIKDTSRYYLRPEGNPGTEFPFVQATFNDNNWETVNLPHDWAIKGPFYKGDNVPVGSGMGRLPSPGVAWYRKALNISATDAGKSIFLDIDGAMSYPMIWLNANLVGGWPYGYNSFRLDLTPFIKPGETNQLAIRIDNPPNSSRWYPGGGIYRNVWLVKTQPVHIGQWGTFITTSNVSKKSATINIKLSIDNDLKNSAAISAETNIFELNEQGIKTGSSVANISFIKTDIEAKQSTCLIAKGQLTNPKLWGPVPTQKPNMYLAITKIFCDGTMVDTYQAPFGIRDLRFDADSGIFVNGEHIYIKGVNQHHDLGALGAAFNVRAAERQLEILLEAGCNSIRLAHNPPAPELLELTDRMGLLVVNEIFDCWERKKTPLDFHLVFPEWHEQDVRSFMQRDRNHPSIIMWSLGNEVGEQYTDEDGVKIAQTLHNIAKEMDATRPTTISMNYAKPPMALPGVMDVICLNYQGEGIRDAPAYKHLRKGRIHTSPLYPSFYEAHPEKVILSSENAAALSSRGEYLFPVNEGISAPCEDGKGGNPKNRHVSSYELYTAQFGSSADKVFRSLDMHPYVAGGFVWSGWDYLGEPTPYYQARSSYFGIIDLAGFKKDRFYLYQSYWRPDLPMAHILPHWNWPGREGEITPVHVFTSGDEAELFLNGKSMGKKAKGRYEYRLRWDNVVYEPGELKVIAYKSGEKWAESYVKTNSESNSLYAEADRTTINADGKDLSFITIKVLDTEGEFVRDAKNKIEFSIEGPGEIIATDNGDPTNLVSFSSIKRKAFNGLALAIVKTIESKPGEIKVSAKSEGLKSVSIVIKSE